MSAAASTALQRLRDAVVTPAGLGELRILCASGALGFGIPRESLAAGFARKPHFVGADMGSIDPGPHYLGSGEMGASEVMARADLEAVITGACAAGIPALVGTAGTAGFGAGDSIVKLVGVQLTGLTAVDANVSTTVASVGLAS